MRTKCAVVLAMFLGVTGVYAAGNERAVLAKVHDFDKEMTYEVLSETDFTALQADIRLEASLGGRALSLAEKAWREDETTKSKMFPRNAVSPRQVTVVGRFPDVEKAESKRTELTDKEAEQAFREAQRAKDREKRLQSIMGRSSTAAAYKKPTATVSEKDTLRDRAVELYRQKIEELKAAAAAKAAAPGESPAAAPEAAPEAAPGAAAPGAAAPEAAAPGAAAGAAPAPAGAK